MKKRFYWLLIFPWVVQISTCTIDGNPQNDLWLDGYDRMVLTCNDSKRAKESAEDLAYTLNEAHERRTAKPIPWCDEDPTAIPCMAGHRQWKDSKKAEWIVTPSTIPPKIWSDEEYNKACGQSDCGADPK